MEILKFPDPNLFKECKQVRVFGPELKIILESMFKTMKESGGIGLASNQVGLDYNMFVMEGPNKEKLFIVNPVVHAKSKAVSRIREGCLSAPGEFVTTGNRAEWIQITYQDETGATKKKHFQDVYAICVQHEMEHLRGESFLESPTLPKKTRRDLATRWGLDK